MQKEIKAMVAELFDTDILDEIDSLEAKVRENEIVEYKKTIKELKDLYPIIVEVLRKADIFDIGEDYYREGIKLEYCTGTNAPYTNHSVIVYVESASSEKSCISFRDRATKDTYTVNIDTEDNYDYYTLHKISEMSIQFIDLFRKRLEKYLSNRRKYVDDLKVKIDQYENRKGRRNNG